MTDTPAGGAAAGSTSHGFQTEARQLLRLMIHSLYSNREIFLRELISNASDAIDKLRFRALADASLVGEDTDYAITLEADAAAATLTIADNGIGMSRQELIDHLGTIARSGTAEFIARLSGEEKRDAALIGQFGVGFYSAFIVADEVTVFSRAAGSDEGWCWRSTPTAPVRPRPSGSTSGSSVTTSTSRWPPCRPGSTRPIWPVPTRPP